MCTESQLKSILDTVAVKAKEVLENRLRGGYLYGSYARGDYDAESDVDNSAPRRRPAGKPVLL